MFRSVSASCNRSTDHSSQYSHSTLVFSHHSHNKDPDCTIGGHRSSLSFYWIVWCRKCAFGQSCCKEKPVSLLHSAMADLDTTGLRWGMKTCGISLAVHSGAPEQFVFYFHGHCPPTCRNLAAAAESLRQNKPRTTQRGRGTFSVKAWGPFTVTCLEIPLK